MYIVHALRFIQRFIITVYVNVSYCIRYMQRQVRFIRYVYLIQTVLDICIGK